MITDQQLQNWGRALSETENAKCISTVASIKKILKDNFGNSVDVFLQGSYKNSTNVRQDSDVDIVVCYKDAYFSDLSRLSEEDRNHHDSLPSHDYLFIQFKNDVEKLMRDKFSNNVERKNKCILIKGNTYRVNADVVPCFSFKRFSSSYSVEAEGIQLLSDDNSKIRSFPNQHYDNGCNKNTNTNQNYKSIVRILKNTKNKLIEDGKIDEKLMSSFFLECLVWNVLHHHFTISGHSHKERTNNIMEVLWKDLSDVEKLNDYAEVSDLMWLFSGRTTRTPDSAKEFLKIAYNLINS